MKRLLVLLLLLLAALPAPVAHADGDPASDWLVSEDVYYPYAPPVSAGLKRTLEGVVKQAAAKGYRLKVALIEAPADLGAYPSLFGNANKYAQLLSSELPLNRTAKGATLHPPVLVVMPSGFGGVMLGDKVDQALSGLTVDAAAKSNGLAAAAARAVARLATVNGHPVKEPSAAALQGGGAAAQTRPSKTSPAVFLAPVVLVFAGLALLIRRGRRAGTDAA